VILWGQRGPFGELHAEAMAQSANSVSVFSIGENTVHGVEEIGGGYAGFGGFQGGVGGFDKAAVSGRYCVIWGAGGEISVEIAEVTIKG